MAGQVSLLGTPGGMPDRSDSHCRARRAEGTFGDGLGAVIGKRETLLMTSLALMKERLKPSWPTGCTSPRG